MSKTKFLRLFWSSLFSLDKHIWVSIIKQNILLDYWLPVNDSWLMAHGILWNKCVSGIENFLVFFCRLCNEKNLTFGIFSKQTLWWTMNILIKANLIGFIWNSKHLNNCNNTFWFASHHERKSTKCRRTQYIAAVARTEWTKWFTAKLTAG